jgi:hypothetical protein
VVLEKDEDQLDRSCEKGESNTQGQQEQEHPIYNKKKEG